MERIERTATGLGTVILCVALSGGLSGCVAAYGGAVGVEVDTGGNLALVSHGWFHGGGTDTHDKDDPGPVPETRNGFFAFPQLGVKLGWSLSHNGPLFGFSIPFFGFVSVDTEAGSAVVGRLLPEAVFIIPIHDEALFQFSVGAMFNLGTITETEVPVFPFPDEEPFDFKIRGLSLNAGIRWTGPLAGGPVRTDGFLFAGGVNEFIDFFDVELGADEPPPQEPVEGSP